MHRCTFHSFCSELTEIPEASLDCPVVAAAAAATATAVLNCTMNIFHFFSLFFHFAFMPFHFTLRRSLSVFRSSTHTHTAAATAVKY